MAITITKCHHLLSDIRHMKKAAGI